MKKLTILFCLLLSNVLQAQPLPEQDCINALEIDSNGVFYFSYYEGGGDNTTEVAGTSCLPGEINSVWLKLTIATSGILAFDICPDVSFDDFDWAVFNLTGTDCSGLSFSTNVSCNFSGSVSPTPCTSANNGPNPQDSPVIDAEAGQVYYIVINRNERGGASGFNVDFTPSTAQISQPTAISQTAITTATVGLYPNPTAGSFTLALDAFKTGQSYTVAIYTATGALVKELKDIRTAQQQVDVANISNGLYYYRLLTADGKTAAGRFVKE